MKKEKQKHTIGDAVSYYLSSMKLSSSSISQYQTLEIKLRDARLLHVEIKDVTPAMVRKFLNKLEVSPSTQYFIYFLKTKCVVNHYIKEHRLNIKIDLKGLLKIPKQIEPPDGEEQYLTLNEVGELAEMDLSDVPKVAYARELFLMMCYSGMAVGDLIGFEPEKAISTDRSGNKWFKYYRKKNNNACTVPLLPMLENVIKRNHWPVSVGKRMVQYNLKPLEALVGRPLSSHWGRHTFGCIMLELGFKMATVSKMMGHTSVSTTEKFYAKVSQDSIMRDMEEMQDRLKTLTQ